MFTIQPVRGDKPEKEAIHSGHFMVSHFEAEAQDDEDELAVPIPEVPEPKNIIEVIPARPAVAGRLDMLKLHVNPQPLAIDTSLSKLFQCMSLAYRQKLTSPKWNRFRGIRLRWKDKIRLNNVIWRCWHMQFIKKENTLICQFASPLDVDTHNKPEAVVLEGKYWKRKLAAVTAEYKKWRMFYRNQSLGHAKDNADIGNEMDLFTWNSQSAENMHMMVDEDYMGLMSDTLFSTITNQPFAFPDTREIAKAGLADFIQPSLGPLQPNLDDYMDTFEPLHELISGKLPTVPEEHGNDHMFKPIGWGYPDLDLMADNANMHDMIDMINQQFKPAVPSIEHKMPMQDLRGQMAGYSGDMAMNNYATKFQNAPKPRKEIKNDSKIRQLLENDFSNKPMEELYQNYKVAEIPSNLCTDNSLRDQNVASFKVPQAANASQSPQGYKFQTTVTPNLKFSSQKEEKPSSRVKGANRGRQRSRSNPRESNKRPPLVTAVSDPALITPSNSVLLTQLLTNSSDNSNIFGRSSEKPPTSTIRIKDENSLLPLITSAKTTTLIITPVTMNAVQNSATDPLLLNSISAASSPALDSSSQSINSPTSSQGSIGSPNRDNSRDHRRVGHIHAEQKRRYNIKNGFDMLHSLIPQLNQNPNAKLSKAAMLQKGAEYIRQLRTERHQLTEEMESLKLEIERLNTSISNCQSLLPATGAPVSRRRDSKIQDMFDKYVRTRTVENWKFWIFSLLFRPLLVSFNNFVSTQSLEDLYRSTLHWIEQHCTLVDLRPVVLNSLRYLCTQTDILSEPENLPEEARAAALSNKHNQHKPN